jgi:hypothetical protein
MTIENFADLVWRRRLLLGAVLLAGAVPGAFFAAWVQPRFAAQASVLMVAEPVPPGFNQPPQMATKPILSTDLPLLATTPTVLLRVARDLRLPASSADLDRLQHRIKARVSPSSSPSGLSSAGVLVVTFVAPAAAEAVAGANAAATEITEFYRESATRRFSALIDDLQRQVQAREREARSLDLQLQRATAADPFLDAKDGRTAAVR